MLDIPAALIHAALWCVYSGISDHNDPVKDLIQRDIAGQHLVLLTDGGKRAAVHGITGKAIGRSVSVHCP